MQRLHVDDLAGRLLRHGGGLERLSVDATGFDLPAPEMADRELLLLNDAIDALAAFDAKTLYTPGARGYTDYPALPA